MAVRVAVRVMRADELLDHEEGGEADEHGEPANGLVEAVRVPAAPAVIVPAMIVPTMTVPAMVVASVVVPIVAMAVAVRAAANLGHRLDVGATRRLEVVRVALKLGGHVLCKHREA